LIYSISSAFARKPIQSTGFKGSTQAQSTLSEVMKNSTVHAKKLTKNHHVLPCMTKEIETLSIKLTIVYAVRPPVELAGKILKFGTRRGAFADRSEQWGSPVAIAINDAPPRFFNYAFSRHLVTLLPPRKKSLYEPNQFRIQNGGGRVPQGCRVARLLGAYRHAISGRVQ
jgi:hypothetical protein